MTADQPDAVPETAPGTAPDAALPPAPPPGSSVVAWLQLFRLPNVFTAMADVLMGFFVVGGMFHLQTEPLAWLVLLLLLAASSLLYTAGMVLNDRFDLEQDRRERPQRPIPSGRIAPAQAAVAGWGLLGGGVLLGWAAGLAAPDLMPWLWRSGVVATLLAALVVAYDARLKRTPAGPVAMGGCRFFNVLLGMTAAGAMHDGQPLWRLGYPGAELVIAAGIGVYIAGVTWMARKEADASSSGQLALATGVIALGLVLLGTLGWWLPPERPLHFAREMVWPMLLLLLAAAIIRRCFVAVADPTPMNVQTAVKVCLISLIILDAAVATALAGWVAGVVVLALLIPATLLGRFLYST